MMYFRKKLLVVGFLCTAIFLSITNASAQLTKAERKAWKKELRKLSPEGLKTMVEEKENLSSTLNLLENQNIQLKSTSSLQEQEIAFLNVELREVSQKLKAREIQYGWLTEENDSSWNGVVFKVQIGALNKKDFTGNKERSHTLEVDHDERFFQYLVGDFRDYKEADLVKKQMRKIGMNKAWIVPYRNGKRVPLKDVLDVVLDN